MKKPKFKLDGATIQKFLVLHCEKIVLVMVLGVMAWLVYMGYSLPGLDADKTPSALASKSDETKKFIEDPTRWTTVVSIERQTAMDLEEKAGFSQIASDPRGYPVPIPWKPENFPKLTPRTDPILFPPQHLIANPVMGPLFSMYQSDDEVDPTYPVISDDDAAKAPKRPAPRPKRPRPGMAGDPYGAAGDVGSADGGGYGGARTSRRGSRRGSGSDSAGGSAGMVSGGPGMPGSGSLDGGYPGMDGYGGMSGMGGAMGGINPESIQGFQGNAQSGIGRHAVAIVVNAVVPFEKQLEEYANALNSSLDYDLNRDQPLYLGLLVQRAEVPANNLAADPQSLTWVKINVNAARIEQIGDPSPPGRYGQWAGVLTEICDPTYLDMNLTHPAPPFMQRNVWPLLTHPDVPLAPVFAGGAYDNLTRPKAPAAGAGDKPIEDVPTIPGGVPGGGYPGGMPGGYPGGAGSADGGYGSGMGMGGSAMMGSGMGMGRSGMMGSGMGGSAGMSMGGDTAGGYGGYGGYGEGMGGMTISPPKYKFVRFTDTHVEPGKHYRYRMKVQVHDPNHPSVGYLPPTLASLSQDVQDRIKTLDAADAKQPPDAMNRPFRTFWRESAEWSQPSEVVSLPPPSLFYAGSVNQPGGAVLVPGKPRIPNTQPSVKVLTSVWDPVKVVDVPAEEPQAYRGSTLNFVKDAKVIHPLNHDVVEFKEYKFQTGGIIADLMGGEPIPKKDRGSSAAALEAPGEILVFDAAGNLRVRNETDDIEEFRRALVPEPDLTQPGGAPGTDPYGAGSADGGYGPAGMSMPGGPGGPSGTRGRPPRGAPRGSSSGP